MTSLIRRHRGARAAGEETASYLPHVPVSMPEAGWGEWLARIARSLNGTINWIQAQPSPMTFDVLPTDAASDAAAAAAGVPIGGMYRNGSVLMVRVT